MLLLGSVPVLNCSDLERSLAFYQQALQFIVLKKRSGEDGLEWVYLQSGDTLLMLEKGGKPGAGGSPTLSRLYLYTDDVAAMHHFLQAKGYAVSPIVNTGYMKEFEIVDPDGQRLSLGQRVEYASGNDD
jgi:catechol 2,3-dioxygenase-like lactoylglutathione lyase family enzyme